MQITFDEALTDGHKNWEDLEAGKIYQSIGTPELLALKGTGSFGYCVRGSAANSIAQFDVWHPGPKSKWVKVEAQLLISAAAL